MAIVYDWYENPNAEGESEERGLHPRPLLNGKVSMEQLYYRVHERSSLSVGDAKSAIDTLTQLCGEELRRRSGGAHRGIGLFFPHFGGHTESDPQDQEQAFETTLERC